MILNDSMGLALGDPAVPPWLIPDPRAGGGFAGPGQHVSTTALARLGFPRVSVAIDGRGIRCIAVERVQQLQQATDSLTTLFGRPPGQRLDYRTSEERVWWGADSRVGLWGVSPERAPGIHGVGIVIVALRSGEPVDTIAGPKC